MFQGKIFGIGFHKTGTSSLARALDLLGYSVTSSYGLMDSDIAETVLQQALEIVPRYDAFQDNPWPIIYRELDAHFPGSKFILTVRPVEKWLASTTRHFGGKTTPMREWIYGGYGDPRGHEEIYRARYERHNAEVQAYFADRPDDFLILDFGAGDGWETLCPFLGFEVPAEPFPHTNQNRGSLQSRLKQGLKRVLPR